RGLSHRVARLEGDRVRGRNLPVAPGRSSRTRPRVCRPFAEVQAAPPPVLVVLGLNGGQSSLEPGIVHHESGVILDQAFVVVDRSYGSILRSPTVMVFMWASSGVADPARSAPTAGSRPGSRRRWNKIAGAFFWPIAARETWVAVMRASPGIATRDRSGC